MTEHRTTMGRAGAVAAAVAVTTALWVFAEPVLGYDLRGPAQGGRGATHDVNAVVVVVASLAASLAGWALLAVVERFIPRHARRIWTTVAVLVLVLSLGGPSSGAGISAANMVWLAAMHLTVGATLIPLMSRTSSSGRDRGRGPAAAAVAASGVRFNAGGEQR
jgi:hypothetical protein